MARYFVDCREHPSEAICSLAISADSKQEVLDAAVQHAVAVHGHEDNPEFREQLRSGGEGGCARLAASVKSLRGHRGGLSESSDGVE